MTFAFWCIAIAAFMPLVWIGYAKVASGGYDNANPRIWRAGLVGKTQRAAAAETNAYEAFPPFAAAVIVAQLAGVDQTVTDILAGIFVAMRIVHGIFYINDQNLFRSLSWATGFFSMVGLFLAAGWTN
ncbi:MAG: MAPEG family protein [Gammaproteobacteria bacterium]